MRAAASGKSGAVEKKIAAPATEPGLRAVSACKATLFTQETTVMPVREFLRIGALGGAIALGLALTPVPPEATAGAGWAPDVEAILPVRVEITTLPLTPSHPA
jgi:hypothetical protein